MSVRLFSDVANDYKPPCLFLSLEKIHLMFFMCVVKPILRLDLYVVSQAAQAFSCSSLSVLCLVQECPYSCTVLFQAHWCIVFNTWCEVMQVSPREPQCSVVNDIVYIIDDELFKSNNNNNHNIKTFFKIFNDFATLRSVHVHSPKYLPHTVSLFVNSSKSLPKACMYDACLV